MNLKQTMRFPLSTPGQKNEGKIAQGGAHLGIYIFFFLNPKHTGKNKPTRLQRLQNVPEAGWHVLTQSWAGSELGIHVRPGHTHVSGEWQHRLVES